MDAQGLLLENSFPEAETPVVRGVKVLGYDSKNGRSYPREVVEKALSLYDGVVVNVDHKPDGGPRKYEDRFGRIVNPRMENDGIYADLMYNPDHPLAGSFEWWAKFDPKAVGLSHNAQAKTKMTSEGVEVIEEIVRVDSVDLVAEPATTSGLLECIMEARKAVNKESSVKEAVPFEAPIGTFTYVEVPVNSKGDINKWREAVKKEGATRISVEKYKHPGTGKNLLIEKAYDKKGNIIGSLFENPDGSLEGAIYRGPTEKDLDKASKGDPKLRAKLVNYYKQVGRKESSLKEAVDVRHLFDEALSQFDSGSIDGINRAHQIVSDSLMVDGYNLLKKIDPTRGMSEPYIYYNYLSKALKFLDKAEKEAEKKGDVSSATHNEVFGYIRAANKIYDKLTRSSKGKRKESAVKKESVSMSKRKKEDVVIPKPDVKTETDDIKKEIESILGDEKMESDEKVERIMACMMPKTEGDEPSAFDEDEAEMDGSVSDIVKMNDEDDDKMEGDLVIKHDDDEKPTEESLRRRQNPALKKLLEEVDAYRARDRREKLVQEARQTCEKAGLPKYAITGEFLGILADSGKQGWKNIIEDRRKVIFRGSTPVSTGTPDGKLSVDSLVKALTN